jgi:hypothetical protein
MRRVLWAWLLIGPTTALAQTAPAAPRGGGAAASESERAAAAAKIARAAAEGYAFSRAASDKRGGRLTLEPKVLLQWSNPVVGSIHGSVFIWTAKGRPEVVASIYKWYGPKNFHLGVEFHSLAAGPVVAEREGGVVWSPTEPGLAYAPLPGAPAPAESPAQRLRQLRALAKEFTASEVDREGVTRELRLLTQPIHRYESTDPAVLDGGLFAFVEGTDPEIFLLLEARRRDDGRYGWDYALARMNSVALRVAHRGREVWSRSELPWDVVFGHRLPYTVFMFDAGQGPNPPDQ